LRPISECLKKSSKLSPLQRSPRFERQTCMHPRLPINWTAMLQQVRPSYGPAPSSRLRR
jgi:hypothetical protein